MLKKDLNSNIHLSEGNIKSKNTDNVLFLTWSLPSRTTCPYATEMCSQKCFAKKRELNFPKVLASRIRNYEETKKDEFIEDMINHLDYQLKRKKVENKKIFVRIHTSGDFYSMDYLIKWIWITNHFKGNEKILFQAYTKSMPILDAYLEEYKTTYGEKFSDKEIIENINIHFVWSIWHDTPKEFTKRAEELGLQTFTALPKDEIETAKRLGAFHCQGDCGNCKQCYTGKVKQIVIKYH